MLSYCGSNGHPRMVFNDFRNLLVTIAVAFTHLFEQYTIISKNIHLRDFMGEDSEHDWAKDIGLENVCRDV